MPGYWRRPEATAEVIGPGRWLRTGDIGRMEGGRLYLASRRRDLIIRGGENIYPVEIENRLEEHPGVAEVAVIPVDHEELGQEVRAVVVPVAGVTLTSNELASWCAEGAVVLQGAGALGHPLRAAAAQRVGQGREAGAARRRAAAVRRRRGLRAEMPLDVAALVAPGHTALVLQEVQNGVVGEHSALPALAEAAAAVDLIPHCAALARAARCRRRPGLPLHRRDPRRPQGREPERGAVLRRAQVAGAALTRQRRGAGAGASSASTRGTSCCPAITASAR